MDDPSQTTRRIGSVSTGMFSASSFSQYSGRSRPGGRPFVQMMMSRVHVVRLSAMPDGAAAAADDDDLLSARVVAVAIGTDVRVLPESVLEARDVRPDVADADGEQEPPCAQRLALRQLRARTRRRST